MRILWDNVFCVFLFALGLGVFIDMREEVVYCVSCIGHISPGNPPGMQWTGLLALGFICITVLGIARFLILKRPADDRRHERGDMYYE